MSQLLRWLVPDWYSPRPGDNTLVVPERILPRGKGKQCPTVLEALTWRVPSHGPKVNWTVIAVEWVQSLVDLGLHSGVKVFFMAAKVTGQDLDVIFGVLVYL